MKSFKISIIAFLLFPLFSWAQTNYKAGYAVTLKGDTLRGAMDLREWGKTPTTVNFRTSANDKIIKLSAHDISYLSISNMAEYQRYAGPITMDNINPDRMNEERDTSFKVAEVFIELIQRGTNVALYKYSDDIKERFFIGEAPDYTPVELGYKLYYNFDKAVSGRTIDENTYQKQLFALAEKYNAITDALVRDFQETRYREADIVNIVSKINHFNKRKSNKKH